jgi:hypothetical protein
MPIGGWPFGPSTGSGLKKNKLKALSPVEGRGRHPLPIQRREFFKPLIYVNLRE